jgi:hypothetical protein
MKASDTEAERGQLAGVTGVFLAGIDLATFVDT